MRGVWWASGGHRTSCRVQSRGDLTSVSMGWLWLLSGDGGGRRGAWRGRSRDTCRGAAAVTQGREDGGLEPAGSSGKGEKRTDLGYHQWK